MPFSTYSELQSSIADELNRSDLATQIVDFISLAETEISRWLRVWWNEKRSYTVPTDPYIILPTDYIGIRNIQWNYSSYRVPLEQVTPEALDQLEILTREGLPQFYAVHDGQFEIRPSPGSGNTTELRISYYYKPTVLSDSNTSNEILVNAPDLLFYCALKIGARRTLDEARYQLYNAEYERIRKEVKLSSKMATWGEGNTLRVRAF